MEWQREGVPFLPKTFPQQDNGAEVAWIIDGCLQLLEDLASICFRYPLKTFLN